MKYLPSHYTQSIEINYKLVIEFQGTCINAYEPSSFLQGIWLLLEHDTFLLSKKASKIKPILEQLESSKEFLIAKLQGFRIPFGGKSPNTQNHNGESSFERRQPRRFR